MLTKTVLNFVGFKGILYQCLNSLKCKTVEGKSLLVIGSVQTMNDVYKYLQKQKGTIKVHLVL